MSNKYQISVKAHPTSLVTTTCLKIYLNISQRVCSRNFLLSKISNICENAKE